MARQTQAQSIENYNEQQALAFFNSVLAQLPDPRRPQGIRYPLSAVVATALMAIVCGCDDAEAIEEWAYVHQQWLHSFLPMPHGSPTQDVYLAVFAALDTTAFELLLQSWADLLVLRLNLQDKHLAVDGKTSRGSFDSSKSNKPIHTVSAWLSDAGLVLAQNKVDEKSKEIKAIPELLKYLNLTNTKVTIDAMGCQTEIAEMIRQRGGHYLLAVKDNQPHLHQELEETFREADDDRRRTFDEVKRPVIEEHEETDGGHGRVEIRRVRICRVLDWVLSSSRWKDLSVLVEVRRERSVLSSGKTTIETHYYIGSDANSGAMRIGRQIRQHWSIENSLHWVLDMAFGEDEARHRAKNTAKNMNTLRHFALNLLKQDKGRKLGIANSRKRAGWDRNYLLHLLTQGTP